MLDKEIFKKMEGRLYGYFRDLKEIEILENIVQWANIHGDS